MSKIVEGCEFYVVIDNDVAICEVISQVSKNKFIVNFKKNLGIEGAARHMIFQTISVSELYEIMISVEEAAQILTENIDFADTYLEGDEYDEETEVS